MQVLKIEVPEALQARWRSWLAPERYPLFLTGDEAARLGWPSRPRAEVQLTPEERDTHAVWAIPPEVDRVVWMGRAEWWSLPGSLQRRLLRLQVAHGRANVPLGRRHADLLPDVPPGRFLWTPDRLTRPVLARVVTQGQAACRRGEVSQSIWDAVSPVLPGVRDLAGTFAEGSAGNCFGAVMGAAGVGGAAGEWVQRDPFESFLRERTRPCGPHSGDESSGTVLLWRSQDGLAQHAAVSLGGGWAFHKASQSWMTPRVVLPVRDIIRGYRTRGHRLERRHLAS